jgi:hypothetical protein
LSNGRVVNYCHQDLIWPGEVAGVIGRIRRVYLNADRQWKRLSMQTFFAKQKKEKNRNNEF